MIGRAVAFKAEDVAAWLIWVNDADIDTVLGNSDLRMSDIAGGLKPCQKPPLEITIRLLTGCPPVLDSAAGRVALIYISSSGPMRLESRRRSRL